MFLCFSFLFSSSITLFSYSESSPSRAFTRSAPAVRSLTFSKSAVSLKFVASGPQLFSVLLLLFSSSITLFSYSESSPSRAFTRSAPAVRSPLTFSKSAVFAEICCFRSSIVFCASPFSLVRASRSLLLQKARLRELSRALLQQSAPLSPFQISGFRRNLLLQVLNCFCASPFSLVRASRSSLTPESSPSRLSRVCSSSPLPSHLFQISGFR